VKVLVCINNKILAEGVKNLIDENVPETLLGDHFFGPPVEGPDIVLFVTRDDILELKQNYSKARFIYFDQGTCDSELACLLYCHGVLGIISSDLDVNKFSKALRRVHQGEVWICQKHLHLLLKQGLTLPDRNKLYKLSDQDRRIIQLVADGESNNAIANKLFLSVPTIKAHLSRIFKCLNVENRAQLAALATKRKDLLDQ
jgi:DNA-binding NarL/FixJ family response regulator